MKRRSSLLVAAMIGAVCTLSGCTSRSVPADSDQPTVVEPVTEVRLNVDGGAAVTIEGKAGVREASVSVEYEGAAPEDPSYEVADGVLTLNGCGPRCAPIYTVTVAEGVEVTGEAANGPVSLTGVRDIDLVSGNGVVTLSRISGGVDLRADNGTIEGRGLRTEHLNVRTTNGPIDLTLATPQDVQAETENGSITLVVPEASYRVSARTNNGPLDIGVPDDPAGQHSLELSTHNGPVVVRSA